MLSAPWSSNVGAVSSLSSSGTVIGAPALQQMSFGPICGRKTLQSLSPHTWISKLLIIISEEQGDVEHKRRGNRETRRCHRAVFKGWMDGLKWHRAQSLEVRMGRMQAVRLWREPLTHASPRHHRGPFTKPRERVDAEWERRLSHSLLKFENFQTGTGCLLWGRLGKMYNAEDSSGSRNPF